MVERLERSKRYMEFIYGALGVVLALGLFAFGAFVGWRIKERMIEAARRSYAEEITEKEREELRAEQEAFSALMGYNIDTAYGLNEGVRADE